ncbi:MAG: starch-binding protein [Duncaniella sp.]|nr:starch-binding protein [Duncaniella sp.]
MKKFYFLMLAMLVAFGAKAWSVKFTNPDNWAQVFVYTWNAAGNQSGAWPGTLMTKAGEVWTYEADTDMPEKIIFNGGNGQPQTNDLNFVDGATYDKNGVLGAVITYEKIYVPYYQYKHDAAYIYSWNPGIFGNPGTQMSKVTENGIEFWMAEVNSDLLPAKVDGWMLHNGSWGDKTGDIAPVEFQANYVYSITDASATPLAEYKLPDNTDDVITYEIRGQLFGNPEWEDYKMTESNGIWSYTGQAVPGNFGIKQMTNGTQTAWYSAPGAYEINANGVYTCSTEGGNNFANMLTGEITLAFDPAALTLTVSGNGSTPEIDYTTWYLNVPGDFNEWNPEGVPFSAEGIATATGLNIGTSTFKIKLWNGSADVWRSNGTEVMIDQEITLTENQEAPMIIAGATDDDIFDVTYDAVNNIMVIKKTGSSRLESIATEASAPAEYYNLQGIRVNNPVSGSLYIVRQGNDVKKVLVK